MALVREESSYWSLNSPDDCIRSHHIGVERIYMMFKTFRIFLSSQQAACEVFHGTPRSLPVTLSLLKGQQWHLLTQWDPQDSALVPASH